MQALSVTCVDLGITCVQLAQLLLMGLTHRVHSGVKVLIEALHALGQFMADLFGALPYPIKPDTDAFIETAGQ